MASNKKLREISVYKKPAITILIAVLLYGLWIFASGIYHNIYFSGTTAFEGVRVNTAPTDYLISFYASAEQDFWFFLFVGLAVFIMSIKDPVDSSLATKVKYIFPRVEETSNHFTFLLEQVDNLSCISPKTSRHYTIEDAVDAVGADIVKLSSKVDVMVQNIHHNATFSTDKMLFKVISDYADKNGVYGQILDLNITKSNSETCCFIEGIHTLRSVNSYESKISMELEAGESCSYKTQSWLYHDVNKDLTINATRFTIDHKVEILNKSTKRLIISQLHSGLERELGIDESIAFDDKDLRTGDRLIFRVKLAA